MKNIIKLIIAIGVALLLPGCSTIESESSVQDQSSQSSYQSDDHIEVIVGDFVFCIPGSSEMADSSTDEITRLSYTVNQDDYQYQLYIESSDKETGKKLHNDTVDFLSNYGKKMVEIANRLAGVTEEYEEPSYDTQIINVDRIGGIKVSLGSGWQIETEGYAFIEVSCFVNDKYYDLSYYAESQHFNTTVWEDFLNKIRPF